MGYYYVLLGVALDASAEEIDAAYLAERKRLLASSKGMAWLRKARLKDLEKAHQVLSVPQERALYDAQIADNIHANMGMPPPA